MLITLGTAPLEDSQFRTAAFEQLGQDRLEGAVTTDIAGKKEAHSVLLDAEAEETLRKAQVHKKTATSVFFESNGGQGEKRQSATVPELRMAVAGPGIDVGNVETALEGLVDRCYYLTLDQNSYYFSLKENLNKRYADRRASVKGRTCSSVSQRLATCTNALWYVSRSARGRVSLLARRTASAMCGRYAATSAAEATPRSSTCPSR